MKLSIAEINSLNKSDFTRLLRGVFEASPWVAERAWEERPFEGVDALHEAMCRAVYNAAPAQKEALIAAHPDLVGKAALRGTLTPESAHEQTSAGLDTLAPDEIAHFARLNRQYRDRFGFPFVICVRENRKEAILSGFASRLHNTREEEITTALKEIARIASLRLHDLISTNNI